MTAAVSPELWSIIEAGVLAPSADNRHFFEVEILQDGLLILGNAAYLAAPYHRKVLSLISFGAVVENMAVRAAALGYKTEPTWLPDPAQPAWIAKLRLASGKPGMTGRNAAIPTRHTNRNVVFSGPALDESTLLSLAEAIRDIDGVSLLFFDSGSRRTKLLRLIWIAESERFNTRALHEDLFSAVRFDVGWHASADFGLPPAALGVEAGTRWAFAQLRHWPVMNVLRHVGFHRALGFRAASLPARLAPHRGVLTTRLPIERGATAVGMALERIWLEAENRGLALQPLAGAALLALPEYEDVPDQTRERLRQGWKPLTEETPLMVFRLGHAKRPAIRTGRPVPETFLRR